MKKFKARVKPAGAHSPAEVRIEAENFAKAKQLLEAQYGRGSVVTDPTEIR